jgi:glycosyltransferase EpsH
MLYIPDKEVFSYKDYPEKIYQVGSFVAWNRLYKRELIYDNDLRFEAIPISDDQYVPNLSMVLAKRITYITDNLMVYRMFIGNSQVDSCTKHPSSSYLATYSVVDKLREYGVYQEVKRSYLNCAVRLMRGYFDKMDKLENLKFLHEKFTGEVFPRLEVENLEDGFFYDERIMDWYRLITEHSVEEILFNAARGYGSPMTSAILRFQLPYDKITKGSRIVLVGKGLTARYWYAQLLISDYAEVVAWVDRKEDVDHSLAFDEILTVEN